MAIRVVRVRTWTAAIIYTMHYQGVRYRSKLLSFGRVRTWRFSKAVLGTRSTYFLEILLFLLRDIFPILLHILSCPWCLDSFKFFVQRVFFLLLALWRGNDQNACHRNRFCTAVLKCSSFEITRCFRACYITFKRRSPFAFCRTIILLTTFIFSLSFSLFPSEN